MTAGMDVRFTGIELECTPDGKVMMRLDGVVLGSGDRIMTADTADELAKALAAKASEARSILEAEARRIADEQELAELRIVGYIPMSVPPGTARAFARALLAAFDVTPKEDAP
jgi:hypothetical protein